MTIDAQGFVALLVADVPEAAPVLEEHLADNYGDLLLHLLMGDLYRLAIALLGDQPEPLNRLLVVLDRALAEGDEYVQNAVAVSFVFGTEAQSPEMARFVRAWPAGLAAEAERQRMWRPDDRP